MEKAHSRIKWENYPSIATPLNEANLNKMDIALDEVDNRVLGLDTAKLDKATANTMIKDISFEEKTGIFTITLLNGTTKTIDTKLEKIATNFSYDYETQKLKLTLADGTEQEIDLSSLLSQYEFTDSDTIILSVDSDGKVTAIVKDGSITEDKLQPNFLADVKVEVAKAKSSSDSAYENATIARESAVDAKTYRDEAEQFRNEVEAASGVTIATTEKAGLVKPDGDTIRVDPDGTIHADRGTTSYTDLENKPKINDVVLEGEKTLEELGIASKEKLEETDNKVNIIIEHAELRFKETANGENIHLDDSAESKAVEFALYGKAKQNTTIGKNLIPYPYDEASGTNRNGVTFNVENGIIVANGTATSGNSYFNIQMRTDTTTPFKLPKGTYILSGCSGGSGTTYDLRAALSDGTTLGTDFGNGFTFTLENESEIGVTIMIRAGVNANNLTFKPMIRLASITDDTWEPYTGGIPSPNPEYPQDIEVAGESGSVEVKSVGKNLLIYPYHETTHTDNGIVWTDNGDGTVTANGTATALSSFLCKVRISPNGLMLGNGTYILSGCPSGGSESTYLIGANVTVNGANNKLGIDTGNGNTITVNGDDYYTDKANVGIYLEIKVGTTVNNLTFKPMIRLATDTDNTWEPYKGKTATITTPNGIAGIPVDNGGNYTDSNGQQWICDEVVKYADGSGEYVQRIYKKVFDGTETFTANSSSTGGGVFFSHQDNLMYKEPTPNTIGNAISNKLKSISGSWIWSNDIDGFSLYDTSGTMRIRLVSLGITTVDDLKAKLKEWHDNDEPLIIFSKINKVVTTPLTPEQLAEIEKLSTFYPVTSISNDADCGMKVKYIADAKSYIDNRLALIEQAMLNSI